MRVLLISIFLVSGCTVNIYKTNNVTGDNNTAAIQGSDVDSAIEDAIKADIEGGAL